MEKKKEPRKFGLLLVRLEMGDNKRMAPAFFVCLKGDGAPNRPNESQRTAGTDL
jgi:hypothetical protein